jgi:hypothetical protein
MQQILPMHIPFQSGWYSFKLPGYRPCKSTYALYPYESLPPLPEGKLTGKLQWLTPLDKDLDENMQRYRLPSDERVRMIDTLKEIVSSARQLGLLLPDVFLQLMSSIDLQDRIPSCTACYFDLSEKIVPCPGSEEGYIIRFLNDQQWCLTWYLYVTPKGEHCTLVSPIWLDGLVTDPEYASNITAQNQSEISKNIYVCSPSFETFIYRFWLENTCWFNLIEHKPLTEEQQQYLSYFTKK